MIMSIQSLIDLEFRPETYWPESENRDQRLTHIKGQARREIIRDALESGGVATLNWIGPEVAGDTLSAGSRQGWGSIHPAFMGGEYLPEYSESEVEIVRISLESVTADQICILAGGQPGDIRYRIVDEYETEYEPAIERSDKPLNLGELIEFIDKTSNPFNPDDGGLIRNHWYYIGGESSPEEGVDFVSVHSAFYTDLSAYFDNEADAWLQLEQVKQEVERARQAEEERKIEEKLIAGSVEIGPELIVQLEKWVSDSLEFDIIGNLKFLGNALEGRGDEVLAFLEKEDSDLAKGIIEKIKAMAGRHYHRNPMAGMYNCPLRRVKREVLGHED